MARLSEGRQTVNPSRRTKLRIRASRGNIASDQDFKTEQADGRHFRRKQGKCPGLQGETTSEYRAVGSKEGSKSKSTMKGNTPMTSTIMSCPRRSRSSDLALPLSFENRVCSATAQLLEIPVAGYGHDSPSR